MACARKRSSFAREAEQLKKRVQRAEAQLQPVYKNSKMREMFEMIDQIAPSDANVLIVGESGVGKEIFANRIHEQSGRSQGPLTQAELCRVSRQHD